MRAIVSYLALVFAAEGLAAVSVIDIASHKQLFIDQRFIERPERATLVMSDAVSIDRNGVAQEIWWKSGPDVSPLAGQPIRLRFKMRSAKLYAFQFSTTPEPLGAR